MSFNGESLSFTTYLMLVFACGASVTVMHYYNKTLAIPHCSVQDATHSNPVKQLMLEKGLYQRHSLDHPLLKDFGNYLRKDLLNENYMQEVRTTIEHCFYS